MRYLIRLLGFCVLVLIPFFACMDFGEPPEGCGSYDWDWGDPDGPGPGPGPGPSPDPCQGVVCPDDGNECTEEYCSGGTCRSSAVSDGTPCDFDEGGAGGFGGSGGVDDDGVCVNGVCGENLCKDVVCDDDDVCTDDSCDYVDGTCHFTPVVCNDHDPCTQDMCDPMDGCNFTPAEDGTECGGRFGMCEAGSCVVPCDLASDEEYPCPIIGLEDLFCCPGSENCRGDCTAPECQSPGDCHDENECTEDRCDYGNCYFTALVCDDRNQCTEDTCDPAEGCVFTAVEDGTACGSGVCVGGECVEIECDGAEDCDDGNECTEDICNGGVCQYPPVEDGTACANGAGACQTGSCIGVTAWTVQNSGTTAPLYSVSFTDVNNATVVGRYGTILRTTDGGATWVEQDSGTTNDLKAVSFTDANTGTVVGFNETILRTTDGGATWVEQDSDIPWGRVEFTGVSFTDAFVGLAVGWHVIVDVYGGAILQTVDGGATWRWEDSGTTNGLNAVSFTGYTAVGEYGTILRRDFWGTWTRQKDYYGNDLRGVSFTDANNGTVVGRDGIILRTTDGGASWRRQDASGPGASLYGVSFADANAGTAVGRYGTILQTRDGGATWVAQESGTTKTLYGVSFTDANTGTAVGNDGTILRTTGGGGG